jgi:ABC-2 type transport system permease protein
MTTSAAASPPGIVQLRSGVSYWAASFGVMLRFEFGRARESAALTVIVQTFMGAGMALTYGFFYPHVTPTVALYVTTGTPTLALIPLGFVMVPGVIGEQKIEGTFDYIWSLPVPRSAQAASTFLLYTLLALPGTLLALLVATWRYGVHLEISPLVVPAVLLCAVTAVTVGFAMALAIANPLTTNLVTNAVIFVVLLFSPIVYPISHLPGWLSETHRILPFYNMAVAMRAGLTRGLVTHAATSFLVLAAWAVAACLSTAWVIGRRR